MGNKTVDEYDDLLLQDIPLPKPFKYMEQYWIYDSFEEYEEKAIESYRQHLRSYFKIIKESFTKFGFKQSRKPFDCTRVEWLVLWNIEYWNKDKILQEISNKTDEFLSLDTVDKAFRQFKEYDLPVRIDKRK